MCMYSINYYDKILLGIATSLSIGALTGASTNIPLQYGLGAGATVSVLLMYDGMFRNGPGE